MGATFCLIESDAQDGFWNMAIDEALAGSVFARKTKEFGGFLRLYSWQKAWISCGYFQKPQELLDEDKQKKYNLPLVRRLSGGGLVLHDKEITYSFACFDDILPKMGVKESYFYLTAFVKDALQSLGFLAEFAKGNRQTSFSQVCSAQKEKYDILISGRKLGGHAQYRKKHFIFQQGFIPLQAGCCSLADILKNPVSSKPAYLADFAKVSEQQLKEKLKEYFSRNLEVGLVKRKLSAEEKEKAAYLKTHKYSRDEWNYEGYSQESLH